MAGVTPIHVALRGLHGDARQASDVVQATMALQLPAVGAGGLRDGGGEILDQSGVASTMILDLRRLANIFMRYTSCVETLRRPT